MRTKSTKLSPDDGVDEVKSVRGFNRGIDRSNGWTDSRGRQHDPIYAIAEKREEICGKSAFAGPYGEPIACAYKQEHAGYCSYNSLPRFEHGGEHEGEVDSLRYLRADIERLKTKLAISQDMSYRLKDSVDINKQEGIAWDRTYGFRIRRGNRVYSVSTTPLNKVKRPGDFEDRDCPSYILYTNNYDWIVEFGFFRSAGWVKTDTLANLPRKVFFRLWEHIEWLKRPSEIFEQEFRAEEYIIAQNEIMGETATVETIRGKLERVRQDIAFAYLHISDETKYCISNREWIHLADEDMITQDYRGKIGKIKDLPVSSLGLPTHFKDEDCD